jgi:hypothetical protein
MVEANPTVVQLAAVTQETPPSWLSVNPDGLGTDWIFQDRPFHRSASSALPEPAK